MRINPKKSSCIRFGARFGLECSNIPTSDDSKLPWSDNFRYLGVYLRSSRSFACSFSHAKHCMYRAFNAVFGNFGRIASPDVVVQLVKTKCLPILCYGIQGCGSRELVLVSRPIKTTFLRSWSWSWSPWSWSRSLGLSSVWSWSRTPWS